MFPQFGRIGVIGLKSASVSLRRRVRPGDETGDARCELDLNGGGGGLAGTWDWVFASFLSSSLSEAWSMSLTSCRPQSVSSRRLQLVFCKLELGSILDSKTDIFRRGFSGILTDSFCPRHLSSEVKDSIYFLHMTYVT